MCGVKQSRAKGKEQKLHVHHKKGIGNWQRVVEVIREELLCDPDDLQVLCPECHYKAEREEQKKTLTKEEVENDREHKA